MNEAENELFKGMAVEHPGKKDIHYKVTYNGSTGKIVATTADDVKVEDVVVESGFNVMEVEKKLFETPGLIANFIVKDARIVPINVNRHAESRLEKSPQGAFATTKDNMLFVDETGDTYGNRDS